MQMEKNSLLLLALSHPTLYLLLHERNILVPVVNIIRLAKGQVKLRHQRPVWIQTRIGRHEGSRVLFNDLGVFPGLVLVVAGIAERDPVFQEKLDGRTPAFGLVVEATIKGNCKIRFPVLFIAMVLFIGTRVKGEYAAPVCLSADRTRVNLHARIFPALVDNHNFRPDKDDFQGLEEEGGRKQVHQLFPNK
jgi:hypothetical protein